MQTDRTLLFMDSEFTGLTQDTSLISIAFVDQEGKQFYAEFSDYNVEQCDDWLNDNVLRYCQWINNQPAFFSHTEDNKTQAYGDRVWVKNALEQWFNQYDAITIWADCPAWDWVLFTQLFGGAFGIPQHIFYMPHDLATLFSLKGFDPDTPRKAFSELDLTQHNALDDALMLRACYQKLMKND